MRHGDGKPTVAEGARARDGSGKIGGRNVVGDVDERQPQFLEGRVVDGRPHRMVGWKAEQGANFETGVDSGHGLGVRGQRLLPPSAFYHFSC